jgi:SAM-dependent methyltransferase
MLELNRYGVIKEFLSGSAKFEVPIDKAYFPNTSERCIEVPYIFSNIKNAKRILDIGISLSDPIYFSGLILLAEMGCELHALDIVPIEKVANRFLAFDQNLLRKINFTVSDVRKIPFKNDYFDLVLCVSVLEHVGFDKFIDAEDTVFDRPIERDVFSFEYNSISEDILSLNEMLRTVKPGGRLLVTVPFGHGGIFTFRDSKGRFATQLEYNKEKWIRLKDSVQYDSLISERCFQMSAIIGWREVSVGTSFNPRLHSSDDVDQGVLCVEFVKK